MYYKYKVLLNTIIMGDKTQSTKKKLQYIKLFYQCIVRVLPFVIAHLSWLNDIVALGTR